VPVRCRNKNGPSEAVPKLASAKPFYLLDPATLTAPFDSAATSAGAPGAAELVELSDMRPVNLIVCGSVAVNRRGVRVGKGAGYSDIEFALLTEAGLIGPDTMIMTTVHQLQVLDEELPETEHDFSVDVIVTRTRSSPAGPRGALAVSCRITSAASRSATSPQ
jgi:5-formyltetrahydrofolate cyclo-ligase